MKFLKVQNSVINCEEVISFNCVKNQLFVLVKRYDNFSLIGEYETEEEAKGALESIYLELIHEELKE
jgi:hypothetical protein